MFYTVLGQYSLLTPELLESALLTQILARNAEFSLSQTDSLAVGMEKRTYAPTGFRLSRPVVLVLVCEV